MLRIHVLSRYITGVLTLLISCCVTTTRVSADLVVTAVVMPMGGQFQYDFTVQNVGLEDISLVTINHAPLNDAVITNTLTGPQGFITSYDPGVGLVDFVEDSALFAAGSTVSGFSFKSIVGPTTNFDTFGYISTLGTISGGQVNVIPEPNGWLLMCVPLLSVVYWRARRCMSAHRT